MSRQGVKQLFLFQMNPNTTMKGVNAQGATTRACVRQATILSHALSLENLGVRTGSVRACVRQIGMASYILEYGIIFIRI